jgi:uncharacterized protein (TIGR04255 family)
MPKYKNPPIIESLCEIKFTEDTNWDITVPGLILEAVKGEYPIKEQRITREISIPKLISSSGKIQPQIKGADFALFFKEDKKSEIQIGPRTLLINRFKPYHSWSDFQSQIIYAFQKLSGKVELNGIQRIGLRYINKIEIPMKDNKVELEEYFQFRPYCGEGLPQTHHGFITGCIFPFFDGRDLCKVELRSALSDIEGSMAFLLDLDYFLAMPRSIHVTQSIEWVEKAHETVEDLFEGCILDPLREIFGEVSE